MLLRLFRFWRNVIDGGGRTAAYACWGRRDGATVRHRRITVDYWLGDLIGSAISWRRLPAAGHQGAHGRPVRSFARAAIAAVEPRRASGGWDVLAAISRRFAIARKFLPGALSFVYVCRSFAA